MRNPALFAFAGTAGCFIQGLYGEESTNTQNRQDRKAF
jgi:hypothetical protein